MKTKLPTTIKPACSALDEGENQNPLRLPWKSIGREFDGFGIVNCESGLVVECLTLNKMQRDAILNGVNEHAALLAVAEAAEIKGTALYLASAASSFTTGLMLVTDGGCMAK